jgi:hypothetical protein
VLTQEIQPEMCVVGMGGGGSGEGSWSGVRGGGCQRVCGIWGLCFTGYIKQQVYAVRAVLLLCSAVVTPICMSTCVLY